MSGLKVSGQLRQSLRDSTDPRPARTREALLAAVGRLHSRGARATVTAIVREAGVSRSSFYAHFDGLDEVAGELMRAALDEMAGLFERTKGVGRQQRAHAMHTTQRRLVDHIAEHRELYLSALWLPKSHGGARVDAVRILADAIHGVLLHESNVPADVDPRLTARYIAGAAMSLLEAWASGEVEADAETVILHLTRLMPLWFSGLEADPVR
ncbi:TetR/AcrR family transcriptional regulator [Okibacterium endophyticum]